MGTKVCSSRRIAATIPVIVATGLFSSYLQTVQAAEKPPTSYSPVVIPEDFDTIAARMEAAKPNIEERQAALLQQRYDLKD
jgi:hypothetical protein